MAEKKKPQDTEQQSEQRWSFDGTEVASARVVRPERYQQLWDQLSRNDTVIALGSGLSYCNASVGDGVVSISSRSFNRILDFDTSTGLIEVETGVSVGELLTVALRHGWYPPVLPGHPHITVGGCVGFNVHGKSQFQSGNFESCISSLRLYHPDHGHLTCSPGEHDELFRMTVGGFGLTGFVTSVRIQLVPLKGKSLCRESISVPDLETAVKVMESRERSTDAVYSWNNLTLKGSSFGAGIVFAECFGEEAAAWHGRFNLLDAVHRRSLRWCVLNRATIPMMHRVYHLGERARGSDVRLPIESGTFPINGKEIYYRLFGHKGLREYQALVPRSKWSDFSRHVQGLLHRFRVSPTLASLKLFRGNQSLLKFNGTGVCLTIDVTSSNSAVELFREIDTAVLAIGGCVNLSKDSRLSRESVQEMFPEYDVFRNFIRGFDTNHRFSSSLRRRIID